MAADRAVTAGMHGSDAEEIPEDKVILFEEGIPGLPDCRRFVDGVVVPETDAPSCS